MKIWNISVWLGLFCLVGGMFSCKKKDYPLAKVTPTNLDSIAANYYEQYLKLYPIEATKQGDNRYNDQLPIHIHEDFISGEVAFYQTILDQLKKIDYNQLPDDKKVIYDVLDFTLNDKIERYVYHPEYIPFTQFEGLPLEFPVLGSGKGSQPFNSKKDYQDWLKRMEKFPEWMTTAIHNFRMGKERKQVLPRVLVLKMIEQMTATELISTDPNKNIFYAPLSQFPKSISIKEQQQIKDGYSSVIQNKIIPAYLQMGEFLKNEYLPAARTTDGYNALPNGNDTYKYWVKSWTTTSLSIAEIKEMGEKEVAMLRYEMEKVKKELGYEGTLESFLQAVKKDPKAVPYQSADVLLSDFHQILKKIEPELKKMFNKTPKTKFEIRQTEKFREATASAEYMPGTPDGKRPGIFYLPIPNPTEFNIASGMESLFLHEAIPGHHYQVALQQENENIPKFMRFGWFGAYGEGWAHYTETLGFELGLYKDPYQRLGYLSDQMLRAVRLVIDTGLHTGTMTREQAIAYFMSNVAYDDQAAVAEVERYMAMPGQALSYKVGALKISDLRKKYSKELGAKFSLAAFHDAVLDQGCLPISVLERKIQMWAKNQK